MIKFHNKNLEMVYLKNILFVLTVFTLVEQGNTSRICFWSLISEVLFQDKLLDEIPTIPIPIEVTKLTDEPVQIELKIDIKETNVQKGAEKESVVVRTAKKQPEKHTSTKIYIPPPQWTLIDDNNVKAPRRTTHYLDFLYISNIYSRATSLSVYLAFKICLVIAVICYTSLSFYLRSRGLRLKDVWRFIYREEESESHSEDTEGTQESSESESTDSEISESENADVPRREFITCRQDKKRINPSKWTTDKIFFYLKQLVADNRTEIPDEDLVNLFLSDDFLRLLSGCIAGEKSLMENLEFLSLEELIQLGKFQCDLLDIGQVGRKERKIHVGIYVQGSVSTQEKKEASEAEKSAVVKKDLNS